MTAVIVAHDGSRWIPHLIESLESSTQFPDQLVAVDTGSRDSTVALLSDSLGPSAVHTVDRSLGFGAAVQSALEVTDAAAAGPAEPGDPDGWLWLLHDDCAPAPDALEQLVAVGESAPGISVVGGRIRAWPRARRLLEVGVTVTGTGHRESGVELGEYDQGQHAEQRDVLSVSSAGMLVRRRTWDALGGFDRRLPLFRDDLDFGWRVAKAGGRVVVAPQAVVFHAEASTRGVRPLDDVAALPNSPHRADRQAALYTLLVNCRALAFPFQCIRLFLGSLLRALGFLVGKLPGTAGEEVLAMGSVLGRPHRVIAARARRRRTSSAPARSVRALLPAWWTPYLNGLDTIVTRFAETLRDTAAQVAAATRRRRPGASGVDAVETGPVPDEAVNLPTGPGPVAWALGHPLLAVTTVLTVAALVATRDLWGGGWLQGGALPPAPASASTWWQTYSESWHHVGLGSRDAPSPYLAVLALASTVLLGKSWLLVQLLVVLAVPLSALGAYVAARRLVDGLGARVWMSASYALLPVLSGAVSTGHLGTTVAVILLPWLVRACVPLVSADRSTGWRAVFASGLVLAVIVAFAPVAWPMAVVAALVGSGWLFSQQERRSEAVRPMVVVALPAALLVPWSWRLLTSPSLLLTEAGRVDLATRPVADHAWEIPWGRLAAAGDAPWWLSLGVVLAALVALIRADRRPQVLAAWGVVLLGLGTTAVLASTVVSLPGGEGQAFVWTGLPVVVAQAAAIVAAGLGADGLSRVVQSGTFGWRQPLAAVTVLLAVVTPVAGLIWWVGAGHQGELTRAPAVPLPAYMTDAMGTDAQQRVLVVSASRARDGTYSDQYTIYTADGYRLGDDSVTPAPPDALTDLVADLLSEAAPDDVDRLADLGIGYVVLPAPYDTDQVAQLDGLAGLSRASTNTHRLAGWQLGLPTGLVRLLHADGSDGHRAAESATVLPSNAGHVHTSVPAGPQRVVVIATATGDGFSARLDSSGLAAAADTSPGTGFNVGPDGGTLEVDPGGHRAWWLLLQALLVLTALVLAAPSVQRPVPATEED